jgi:hypothetical protein
MKKRHPVLALWVMSALAVGVWLIHKSLTRPLPRAALSIEAVEKKRSFPQILTRSLGASAPEAELTAEAPKLPDAPATVRNWHPRDPAEWQGMLVDLDTVPPCDSSAVCGLARACKAGKCLACERDGDCATGEACVLDHCVAKELATCRKAADCKSGSLCVLSGYSGEPRGNEGMKAACVDPASGASKGPEPLEVAVDTRTVLPDDDLLKSAREAPAAAQ